VRDPAGAARPQEVAGGPAAFFTSPDGRWFEPTALARGPWDADSCHAGPPTGLLARASELAVPGQPLVRLTVDLVRAVPMAGFAVEAEVTRAGRTVSTTVVRMLTGARAESTSARGLHVASYDGGEAGGAHGLGDVPTAEVDGPRLVEAVPGRFPITRTVHGLTCFVDAVETAFPPGQDGSTGPSTLWMRAPRLIAEEEPSAFQRICPLADCGNAVSRNEDVGRLAFMNADLTIALHRRPEGEWFASESVSHWHADGHGISDSRLHDVHGPVGRAVQTLLLRPLGR
jgi:hypothetical protein